MMYACRSGSLEAVELLLEHSGLDDEACREQVQAVDLVGSTPLMAACSRGALLIVKTLLLRNAHVDARKATTMLPSLPSPPPLPTRPGPVGGGGSALSIAVRGQHTEVVDVLLRSRANPEVPSVAGAMSGACALSEACAVGEEAIARLLINAKASIGVDDSGCVPLCYAAKHGHNQIVRVLIERRADPTQPRSDGMTPLMCAARPGHVGVVHELLKVLGEKDVDAKRAKDGATALIMAVRNGEDDVAAMLVHRGASVRLVDSKGVSAMAALQASVEAQAAQPLTARRTSSNNLLREMFSAAEQVGVNSV